MRTRKVVVLVALLGASAALTTSLGACDGPTRVAPLPEDFDSGDDSSVARPADGGPDGAFDGGSDGGLDALVDGGLDAGLDSGADAPDDGG